MLYFSIYEESTSEKVPIFHVLAVGIIFNVIQAGKHKFSELKQMTSGQLRLAVCSAVCKYDLLQYISQYNFNYPDVYLYIKDELSYEIVQLLNTEKIDIGIINPHNLDSDKFNTIKTLEMNDCFVVGEKYKALCRNFINFLRMASCPQLLRSIS